MVLEGDGIAVRGGLAWWKAGGGSGLVFAHEGAAIVDDVLQVMDFVRAVGIEVDGDEIEAEEAFAGAVGAHEMECGTGEAVAFAGREGSFGEFVAIRGTGFDFDKDEGIAVFGDEVDFASGAAVIALHDAQAASAEEVSCEAFAEGAGCVVRVVRCRGRGR